MTTATMNTTATIVTTITSMTDTTTFTGSGDYHHRPGSSNQRIGLRPPPLTFHSISGRGHLTSSSSQTLHFSCSNNAPLFHWPSSRLPSYPNSMTERRPSGADKLWFAQFQNAGNTVLVATSIPTGHYSTRAWKSKGQCESSYSATHSSNKSGKSLPPSTRSTRTCATVRPAFSHRSSVVDNGETKIRTLGSAYNTRR